MNFWINRKRGRDAKMGNIRSTCEMGHSHRSKLESSVCQILQLRAKSGEIEIVQVEDHITICGPIGHECPKRIEYVADFKCRDLVSGNFFHVEAKGFADAKWPRTKNLWRHYGPNKLEIWKGSHSRPKLDEEIFPCSHS